MPPGLVQLSFEVSSSSGIVKAGSARPRFAEDGVGHMVAATEVVAAKAARKMDFVENIVKKDLCMSRESLKGKKDRSRKRERKWLVVNVLYPRRAGCTSEKTVGLRLKRFVVKGPGSVWEEGKVAA